MSLSRVAAACLLAASLVGTVAWAGGGPENVLLVVNPARADSLAVANAYASLRHVPPGNVLMLPWQDGDEAVPIDRFRAEILQPILRTIDARRLSSQIDCIAYSCGFPWRVDFAAEMPADLAKQQIYKFPSGSLTGMTMLYVAVQSGGPNWLDPASNQYFRPPGPDGAPTSTIGFRNWYGWSERGDVLDVGGSRYLLATMLGVTAGRGNSVAEIVRSLEAAAAADGTRPRGTIYFLTSGDVRSKARSGPIKGTAQAIVAAGVKAEILEGTLPQGRRDVAGLVTGTPDFDWQASGSGLVPGAICDNLTSFGGVFTPDAGQTPLSDGHHDLRVVAIAASEIETQGRRIVPITVANHGRSLTLTVEPRRVRPADTVRVTLAGSDVESGVVFCMGRVLGRTTAGEATIEVPAELLGRGRAVIRATARTGPRPADAVNAAPVTVEVVE
jgi:hypothetical protein